MLIFLLVISIINLFFSVVTQANNGISTLFFKVLPFIGSMGTIVLILKIMEVL